MDDNQQSSSWDDLIQDLGAKPDESAYERRQPPAQEIPSAIELVGGGVVEETPQSSADWNSLAESLGIEAEESSRPEPVEATSPAPIVEQSVIEEAVTEEPAAEEAIAEESGSETATTIPFGGSWASEAEFAEKAPSQVEKETVEQDESDATAAIEAQQDDELPPLPTQIDQAMSDSAWVDDQDEAEQSAASETSEATPNELDGDEQDGGGISGEAARSAFDALFADGASGWGSAFLDRPKPVDEEGSLVNSLPDELSELGGSAVDKLEGDEDSEKPKRKRSRRRRRGGKGRKPAGEKAAGEENAEEQEGSATDGLSDEVSTEKTKKPGRSRSRRGPRPAGTKDKRIRDDLDDDQDDLNDDPADEGEDSPRGAARGRKRHANLPTWTEAIGMIVDGNLEQRAKSPSKPKSSRSRGGRGGGGRRRSSKKPESK